MNVSRKLFIAMASFIVAMSLVFVLVTHLVIRESLEVIVEKSRGEEIEVLSRELIGYYQKNGGSWEGVQPFDVPQSGIRNNSEEASFLLLTMDQNRIMAKGTANEKLVKNLGIERNIRMDGKTIAILYYYDPEVANLSKLRIGIPVSVTFLLSVSAIVFILISIWIAYWISKRITAPLRKLIPAIDRLGQGEFGIQAPVLTKDEYGKVAVAFNGMSKQLQVSEEVRRNLVADVAHELRTPLTIIRGKLDLVQQGGRSIEPESLLPLQDELIRLTRLVDDLHLLSLAEAKKLPYERKLTDISDLLNRIIDHVASDAGHKDIALMFKSDTDHTAIPLDPNQMTQVFLNLLVNAIRYTPSGGSVNITVEEESSAMLRITVADNGPGIDPEHLPYLFNRFYRTDEARARNTGNSGTFHIILKP
ncbi:MAG: Sensory transduction histidine kinase [Paenibacillus sp.]|jgi:two-component system sensor histidine kinase BaeS|nr:Sensory transduction histidine kinase [Paenibacillus sp.]